MKKRISAFLLAFMVMVSACPALAFAETEGQDNAAAETALEAAGSDVIEEAAPAEEAVEATEEEAVEEEAQEVTAAEESVKLEAAGDVALEEPEEEEPITLGKYTYSEKTSKYVVLTWRLYKGGKVFTENRKGNFEVYAKVKKSDEDYEKQAVKVKFDSSTSTYSAKVTGLAPNTRYSFKIAETQEDISLERNVKTNAAIANVKGFKTYSTYNSVILKWNRVKGATGYTIRWKSGSKSGTVKIKKGSVVKYTHKLPASLKTKTIVYSIVATRTGYGSSAKKATAKGEAIRTMYISIKFTTTRSLTSHDSSKKTTVFPAGTTVQAYGYNWGRYIFDYKGHTYYVKRYSVGGQSYAQLNTDKTYSKTEAQLFVNSRGLRSNTDTLIWVNTFTQKLYLFKGSKGRWKLYKGPWDVCTGKAKTPTATGLTRVKSKTVGCHDPFPQTPWWCVTAQFSIHGKAPYYPAMGQPASNGCVRNWSKNAKWMYYNVPVGTAVFIF